MAGVINSTQRQIDIRVAFPTKVKNVMRQASASLNPGFNVVNDEIWEAAQKNKIVKLYLAGGALVGNAKKTREDELVEEKVRTELQQSGVHELERTKRVASVIPGDANVQDHTAVAVGAGADGSDVVENGGSGDDLL